MRYVLIFNGLKDINYEWTTKEIWKVEREVDEYNESYRYREGYVKVMCDAINLVKNLDIPLVSVSLPTPEEIWEKADEMLPSEFTEWYKENVGYER